MATYLHLFKNDSDFETFINSVSYLEPFLSATQINGEEDAYRVDYNQGYPEPQQDPPLTFEITSPGNIIWLAQSIDYPLTIEYSKNDGAWTEITSSINGELTTSFTTEDGTFYYVGFDEEEMWMIMYSGETGVLYADNETVYEGDYVYDIDWNSYEVLSVENESYSAPTISVVSGDTVQFRGDNATYSSDFNSNFKGTTCGFNLKGNIMSMVNSTGYSTATTLESDYTFRSLFDNCRGLVDASELILPATTLTERCYESLFSGCLSLTGIPALPATTLAPYCYAGMFQDCTSLTTVPSDYLPVMTLESACYSWMFEDCTGLTTAPELPATALTHSCYYRMFTRCTSLTTAPELPATALTVQCYQYMFSGCTNLETAPELPATKLELRCYNTMFFGCGKINYIKCLATNLSAYACTEKWLNGVSATGTFVKNPNMTGWTTGNDGIPNGWTVEDAS